MKYLINKDIDFLIAEKLITNGNPSFGRVINAIGILY